MYLISSPKYSNRQYVVLLKLLWILVYGVGVTAVHKGPNCRRTQTSLLGFWISETHNNKKKEVITNNFNFLSKISGL